MTGPEMLLRQILALHLIGIIWVHLFAWSRQAGCNCLSPLDTICTELWNMARLSIQRLEMPSLWTCFLINLVNYQKRVFTIPFNGLISKANLQQCMCNTDVSPKWKLWTIGCSSWHRREKSSKGPTESTCTFKSVKKNQNKWDVLQL